MSIGLKPRDQSADTRGEVVVVILRSAVSLGVLVAVLAGCDDSANPTPDEQERIEGAADGGDEDGDDRAPQADAGAPAQNGDSGSPAPKGDAAIADAGSSPVETDAGPVQPACDVYWYRDSDHDGFGDPSTGLASCTEPYGYVSDKSDCYDANSKAKPGQTGRFAAHRGDGSYDYDCDGVARPRANKVAEVPDVAGAACPPPNETQPGVPCDYAAQVAPWRVAMDGWYMSVPACGASGFTGPGCVLEWLPETTSYICTPYTPSPDSPKMIQSCN